jgi:NAD(P)-dependent dehydrogenase (short-subunit alcohol dehydrogenase family)
MLHGKTAIVTGSTSGIGLGIATALAAEGASIMLRESLKKSSTSDSVVIHNRGVT